MEAYVYILYSANLDRYYTGSTALLPSERLSAHLSKVYGPAKFTAKANDWDLKFSLACPNISVARKIESHIKRMKSPRYTSSLIAYPEISKKLLDKYE